jgi:hypothetical protein
MIAFIRFFKIFFSRLIRTALFKLYHEKSLRIRTIIIEIIQVRKQWMSRRLNINWTNELKLKLIGQRVIRMKTTKTKIIK